MDISRGEGNHPSRVVVPASILLTSLVRWNSKLGSVEVCSGNGTAISVSNRDGLAGSLLPMPMFTWKLIAQSWRARAVPSKDEIGYIISRRGSSATNF